MGRGGYDWNLGHGIRLVFWMAVKFPGTHDRTAVLGRTGSGKTTKACWLLSGKDFNAQPWCMVNTKGDPLINEIAQIEGVKRIGIDDTPGDTGLYVVDPLPGEQAKLDAFFFRIWEKQNCGVYIDEGYMIEVTDGMNALLTQGRSRECPMIVLSQRPAWISKFVFSEADFISVFQLQHLDDRKSVSKFVPIDVNARLPKHHSFWYNVSDNELTRFAPVPPKAQIINNFKAALPPQAAEPEVTLTGPESVQRAIGRKIFV